MMIGQRKAHGWAGTAGIGLLFWRQCVRPRIINGERVRRDIEYSVEIGENVCTSG